MALSLLEHFVNANNRCLDVVKMMGYRDTVNTWITKNKGVLPDTFLPFDDFKVLWESKSKPGVVVPNHEKHNGIMLAYIAMAWQYSRHNAMVDFRIGAEVLTTEVGGVFHGEIFRRMPHWSMRVEIHDCSRTDPNDVFGTDMMITRAVIEGKDAIIVGNTVMRGPDAERDLTFGVYALDLDQPTIFEALASLNQFNLHPETGEMFTADDVEQVKKFIQYPMFVCSQLPPQPKSAGRVHHQSVRVKKKSKGWVIQPANKVNTVFYGSGIADVMEEQNGKTQEWRYPESSRGSFIGEWDDMNAEDPTFYLDWVPPSLEPNGKNEEE